jgi:hypothetical protein
MMETAFAGGADIHSWALADRFKPFEYGDRAGII